LFDRIGKSVPLVAQTGRPTIFSAEQEEEIVQKIQSKAEHGDAMTKADIKKELASKLVDMHVEERNGNDLTALPLPAQSTFWRKPF